MSPERFKELQEKFRCDVANYFEVTEYVLELEARLKAVEEATKEHAPYDRITNGPGWLLAMEYIEQILEGEES